MLRWISRSCGSPYDGRLDRGYLRKEAYVDSGDRVRTRVFLSYSRRDTDFVVWLSSALNREGFLVDFDLSTEDPAGVSAGISAEDQWWVRLRDLITAADAIVFVVSPDSASSRVCDEEIAYGQALGKRIIPVLCRPVDFATAPPRLSALNVKISFTRAGERELADSLGRLTAAINQDVSWLRTAARLLTTARRWETAGHAHDHLLRGAELRDAESWSARRPASAPQHPEVVLEFLDQSRNADDERRTIEDVEKARYLELIGVIKPFLEAEVSVRERQPKSDHYGVAQENQLELAFVRSLLSLDNRWHPQGAVYLQSTGAADGYAEIFRFPCCETIVRDFRSTGETDPPSQFRADGCREVPEAARHAYRERSNPFRSELIRQFRALTGSRDQGQGRAIGATQENSAL
jgi:TIR domain